MITPAQGRVGNSGPCSIFRNTIRVGSMSTRGTTRRWRRTTGSGTQPGSLPIARSGSLSEKAVAHRNDEGSEQCLR